MNDTIAQRIRALREERRWSKLELGRRVGVKNGHVAVHRWETGRVVPSPINVEKLANVFEVPVSEVDPSGSAYNLTGPRKKSHGVDNSADVGKIPYSQPQPPTTTEGLMRDQMRGLQGALEIVPPEHRDRFVSQAKRLAAQMLLQSEVPGVLPGKEKRAGGKG